MDAVNSASDETEQKDRMAARLSTLVAITIALVATFLGVCKVKDDNIVQAMQQAQADKLDHWAFYQARNIRQEIANATADELRLAAKGAAAAQQADYQKSIATYDALASDQATKKEEVRAQAEQDQKNYD